MVKFIKVLAVIFLLGVLTLLASLYYFEQGVHKVINIAQPTIFDVKSGQSAKGLLNQLKSNRVLEQNIGLKIRLKLQPELAKIKAGTYELQPNMTALEMLELFSSGKEIQFTIGLVEGLRWRDWLQTLKGHPNLSHTESLQEEVNKYLSSLPHDTLEGLLLPDTYAFTKNTPAIDVVKRAYQQMQSYLEQAWLNRALDLPYETPYEALIMASIVEKETGLASERPRIAGVFVNRLNLNMRLQTDPTVIYGMGEGFDGDIRRKDLKAPTPYNTYVIKGLPPTPIAMPSKLAIDAALKPLETEDLYFVSKGDGSHYFSETLQEHNSAVRKYQLKK
ncbi:endolytic transglycosylase MltG [Paraglaciecola aquimarina]|uniref:Endolytic murein transglycosylase n=1 Tax=Paraglaciecola algarum TaxID=3050085 RepID=A0ABS9DBQ7_9ALTE|nr:endolytic transglycosylase MltG [Paraglaciecola sp. G1-23]MCF2950390.1 endolytic transglycosylase MltG [Paraglaciecola sp. G1-23]